MRRCLSLMRCLVMRDVMLFLSDRRAAALCFVVPILLGSLFGIVFDHPTRGMGKMRLPLLVVDEDDTPQSRQVVASLLESPHLEAQAADRATMERQIEKRRFPVAVCFPPGFGQQLARPLSDGVRPRFSLLHHPLSAMEAEWAEGVLTELLMKQLAREWIPAGSTLSGAIDRPFDLTQTTIPAQGAARFNSYSHSFSGMMLQYLLFWGMESGLLFLRERRRGIWNRMRMTPVPVWVTLLSRIVSSSLIGLVQLLVTFAFAWAAFGVTVTGSMLGFGLLLILISFFAAVLGLLVATMSGTEPRARNVCILMILVFSMLGGLWLPTFLLPQWVQELSLSLPTTWAMRGLDGVTWMGSGFAQVLPCVVAVLGFSLVGLGLAWARFSRMERNSRRGVLA